MIDLDGDGDVDVLTSNGDSLDYSVLKPYNGIQWFENLGRGGRFREHSIAPLYGCSRAVGGDVDSDGDVDIVAVSFMPLFTPEEWKRYDLDSVIWIENSGGKWIRHSIEKHRACHPTVDLADYNQDGALDIAVGNYVWLHEKKGPLLRTDYVTLFTGRQPTDQAGDGPR